MELDFSDLNDETIQKKLTNFHNSLGKVESIINLATTRADDENISLYDKINLNIFMAYSLNSLYWLYLRTKGIDPNQNEVKNQLARIREYMQKAKAAHERKTLRPAKDPKIVQRIVQHYIKDNKDAGKSDDGPESKKPRLN